MAFDIGLFARKVAARREAQGFSLGELSSVTGMALGVHVSSPPSEPRDLATHDSARFRGTVHRTVGPVVPSDFEGLRIGRRGSRVLWRPPTPKIFTAPVKPRRAPTSKAAVSETNNNGGRAPEGPSPTAANGHDQGGGPVDEGYEQEYGSTLPELLDFLRHEKGAQLADKVLVLFEGLRKATVDARAAERALQLEIKKLELQREQHNQERWAALSRLHLNWRSWVQTLGRLGVVGGIVYLSANKTLEPAAGTILGAVAGYLFGEDRTIRPKS